MAVVRRFLAGSSGLKRRNASIFAFILATVGCSFERPSALDAFDGDSSLFPGLGVGAFCVASEACRNGLVCVASACRPAGNREANDKCILSAECKPGLVCGIFGACVQADTTEVGGPCSVDSDCQQGLYCKRKGISGHCARHNTLFRDLFEPCAETADCLAGLVCSARSHQCVPGSLLLNPDIFPGITCAPEEGLPFGARMVVPRAGVESPFYDFPFPTDVRRKAGRIDLSSHPRPGPGPAGFDSLGALLDAASEDLDGFGVNPLISFRFTREVDASSLRMGFTVRFVDLTTGAEVPGLVQFVAKRDKYSCGNRVVIRPPHGVPLVGGRQYAVVITRGIRSVANQAPVPLDDLEALLGPAEPAADPPLRAAWEVYGPLRKWLLASHLAASDVAAATVFSTYDPFRRVQALFAAKADPPALHDVTVCAPGVRSPCAALAGAGPDPRNCPDAPIPGLMELHGLIRLPVWQKGDVPHETTGGDIVVEKPVRYEDVCIAFAIPSGPMPKSGWPVVVYAHGTAANFRTGIAVFGKDLAALGIAMASIDQPLHGPRQGGGNLDPGPLFYNFANPRAARGNVLQGAMDNLALARFLAEHKGGIGPFKDVRFDGSRMVFFGHSQGATTGAISSPADDRVKGVVFTGLGGSVIQGLMGKKKPYDAALGTRAALHELVLEDTHPALGLLQMYLDEVDPMVHGQLLLKGASGKAHSVLNVLGWDDTYTPFKAGLCYAKALGAPLAQPDNRPEGLNMAGFDPVADLHMAKANLPLSGNITVGQQKVTAATVANRGDDLCNGHFIAEVLPKTRSQTIAFIDSLVHSTIPIIPE